jgi:topoisomerase-4 subunit A
MIKNRPLSEHAQIAYRDYALYVLLDRALPRLNDGLKPVQRRILFAMEELGLHSQAKPKKSARTIGDVLGKYHPHSDQACYEALVHLAQGFATRYPLIKGQGNFGSLDDPKSFAAMRYTEVRLAPIAQLLFEELSTASVPWQPNFDGSLSEPVYLPAQIPFLLLNGCSGIAVGMSTEIPPHNICDVIDTLLWALTHPKATTTELLHQLKGPDFPTGGNLLVSREDLLKFYEEGKGAFLVQARIEQEKNQLIITEIPYMTTVSRIIEQIQNLILQKTLPSCELMDESDEQQQVRLSLTFKNSPNASLARDILLDKTELSKVYRCYFHGLNEKTLPTSFNLRDYINQWLEQRVSSLTQQAQARLNEIKEKRHILQAYLLAFNNLSQLWLILQHSDEPWTAIQNLLKIDDQQTEALSHLKLRQLTKMSAQQIQEEDRQLDTEQQTLMARLSSPAKMTAFIKKGLESIAQKYGDKRRTTIIETTALSTNKPIKKALKKESDTEVEAKEIAVALTTLGWVKALRTDKEWQDVPLRQGDQLLFKTDVTKSHHFVLIDNSGRFYTLSQDQLPASRYGEHFSTLISTASGAQIVCLAPQRDFVFLITSECYGFRCDLNMVQSQKRGKHILKMLENERLLSALHGTDQDDIIFYDSINAKLAILPFDQIPARLSGRGALLCRIAHISHIFRHKHNEPLQARHSSGKIVILSREQFLIKRGGSAKSMPKNTSMTLSQ